MNKKLIAFVIIILIAIILLILGGGKTQEAPLPTRDVEGVEPIENVEEYCEKITDLQEFDDSQKAQEFYQDCLKENK